MNLGNLATVLVNLTDLTEDKFVFSEGFSGAHSYRGYYDEVSFSWKREVSLKEVKDEVRKALTEEFTGWKGGEFRYDANTPVHMSSPGYSSDEDGTEFEALLGRMLVEFMTNS